MKKLLLTIAIACMGCGEPCIAPLPDLSGGTEETIPACEQSSSCGFLKEWDACTCRCEWWGGF